MIDKDNIESKDFSIELSEIVSKLQAIACLTKYNSDNQIDNSINLDLTHGLGFIIQDAVDDLQQINDALYPGSKAVPED